MIGAAFRIAALGAIATAALAAQQSPVVSEAPIAHVWVPDGDVAVVEAAGNRIYVGGPFSAFGPDTGAFAVTSASGAPSPVAFPPVDGIVRAVEPDGAGGWFLAGPFTRVGAEERDGLAHVLASGALDAWAPQVNGEAKSLLYSGGILYVGGSFFSIGTTARKCLAAFDASLNLLPWNPAVGGSFAAYEGVFELAALPGAIYAGGLFQTTFGGAPRRNLVAVDPISGAPLAADPSPDGRVDALVAEGTSVWVGGNFATIGGAARARIAQLDAATGAASAFSVGADKDVLALARDGASLYVGGAFAHLGGVARSACGAIDVATQTVTAFDPMAGGAGNQVLTIEAIAVDAGTAYLGGSFRTLGAAERWHLGAVDAQSGAVLAFVAQVAGPGSPTVFDLAPQRGSLGVAGDFRSVGAVRRHGAAAFDADTLELLPWAPDFEDSFLPGVAASVEAFAFDGATVFAAGAFGFVNGLQRCRVAAVDAVTGATIPAFDAGLPLNADGIGSLTLLDGGLLADLSKLFDRASGQKIASWNVDSNLPPEVVRPLWNGAAVWAGGGFDEAGPLGGPYSSAHKLLACDPYFGAIASGIPAADKTVHALRSDRGRVVIGGAFDVVAGLTRRRVAEIDLATLAPTAFAPDVGGDDVLAVAQMPGLVFCGGRFASIGIGSFPRLAAIDRATSQPYFWKPKPDGQVAAIAAHRDLLVAGGSFRNLFTGPRPSLAIYRVSTLFAGAPSISLSAGGAVALDVAPGAALAGRKYWVLGSVSGTAPGFDLLGSHVPLNLDAYLLFGLAQPSAPLIANGFGTLGPTGAATATFALPAAAPPSLQGVTVAHAAIVFDPSIPKPLFVTNAVTTALVE